MSYLVTTRILLIRDENFHHGSQKKRHQTASVMISYIVMD
jgi:hypothetical protein